MEPFFGLDFGTSNSALSVNISGKVRLIDIDKFNVSGYTMKTVIYFDDDDKRFCFGQEAVNLYVENDAIGRYVQSIKSFLPDKAFSGTSFGGKFYELDEIVAIILREIKNRGENEVRKKIDKVVLGRPVVFSEDPEFDKLAENRLASAARKAGFREIHFQKEPIAAALAFEEFSGLKKEKISLVGDFGGGTSDFAVVRIGASNGKIGISRDSDILSVSGAHVGGDDFDSLIMWEKIARYFGRFVTLKTMDSTIRKTNERVEIPSTLYRNLCEWHQIPRLRVPKMMDSIARYKYLADEDGKQLISNLENLINDNYGYMLFRSIENAKRELSRVKIAEVLFKERGLGINERISREEFEAIINPKVEVIKSCINDALLKAGVTRNQIDVIVLTGGSSHIPYIKRLFSEIFPRKEIVHKDAFTGVAYGLGC